MPRKLVIAPDQEGYSVAPGNEFLSVALQGGRSKQRRDIVGATSQVRVQWSTDRSGFNYLSAFYRLYVQNPTEGFLIDLYMGEAALTQHTAYFVPDSWSLDSNEGHGFDVSATLEVMPRNYSVDDDTALVDYYEAYGEEGELVLNLLEKLVNVTMPRTFR